MPGLATHILFNTITGKVCRAGKYLPFFILGSLLPDVLTRVPSNCLRIVNKLCWKFYHVDIPPYSSNISWFMAPFHTPFILLLLCYLISLGFPLPIRKPIFGWLGGGILVHLILDAMQRHNVFDYYWLFPFSWQSYRQGLFWPETPLFSLPLLFVIWLIMIVTDRKLEKIAQELRF